MKLEDQVVSLELAKRLKELGVKQESIFIWILNKEDHPKAGWSIFANSPYVQRNLKWQDQCSAFTVAELGFILKEYSFSRYGKESNVFICTDVDNNIYISDNTEANARAKMLVYLIENKLIEVKDVG